MSRFFRWRERVRHRPAFAPLRALLGCAWVGGAIFLGSATTRLLPAGAKTVAPLFLAAAALFGYWLFVRIVERRDVAELGSRRWPGELLVGCAIGFCLFAAVIGVLALLGNYAVVGVNGWSVVAPVLTLSIMAAVTEELIVRAVVFRILEGWLGSWLSLGFSAVLFGALHLANANATVLSSAALAIEAGVMLAAAFMVTRHVWLAIGIHFAWNFTQSGIFGVATSGVLLPGYLQGRLQGAPFLSGGSFGPEASIVAVVVCLAAGLLMIRVAAARGHVVAPSWRREPGEPTSIASSAGAAPGSSPALPQQGR